jgi:hypothetical protein
LVVQQAFLDRGEELFGLLERQPQMLDALGVLLQGDEVCHGFFTAIIAAQNQLQFDVHGEGSSGSGGGGMMQVILPEFVDDPQLLHALLDGGGLLVANGQFSDAPGFRGKITTH